LWGKKPATPGPGNGPFGRPDALPNPLPARETRGADSLGNSAWHFSNGRGRGRFGAEQKRRSALYFTLCLPRVAGEEKKIKGKSTRAWAGPCGPLRPSACRSGQSGFQGAGLEKNKGLGAQGPRLRRWGARSLGGEPWGGAGAEASGGRCGQNEGRQKLWGARGERGLGQGRRGEQGEAVPGRVGGGRPTVSRRVMSKRRIRRAPIGGRNPLPSDYSKTLMLGRPRAGAPAKPPRSGAMCGPRKGRGRAPCRWGWAGDCQAVVGGWESLGVRWELLGPRPNQGLEDRFGMGAGTALRPGFSIGCFLELVLGHFFSHLLIGWLFYPGNGGGLLGPLERGGISGREP